MPTIYDLAEANVNKAYRLKCAGKSDQALDVLLKFIKKGVMRTKTSQMMIEHVMFQFLELCVDLKKPLEAKEGLKKHMKIFQKVNIYSVVTVIEFYLHFINDRMETVWNEVHSTPAVTFEVKEIDVSDKTTFYTGSLEDNRKCVDQPELRRWKNFWWKTYKFTLEMLQYNINFTELYHNMAQNALKVCWKYNMTTEFRKLSDFLKKPCKNLKMTQETTTTFAVNINDFKSQNLILRVRLVQLNSAIGMKLSGDVMESIEVTFELLKKFKKARPSLVAAFYEKLAALFWESGNILYHAAVLFILLKLSRAQRSVTSEELNKKCSAVLLATLAIPLAPYYIKFNSFCATESSWRGNEDWLANLLSLPKPPTRKSLIKNLNHLNIISSAPIELQNLYKLMESEFDPLNLCHRMEVHLTWIRNEADSDLPQYVSALQEMAVAHLVKQVALVYQTITFQRLLELSIFMTRFSLERLLMKLHTQNIVQVRIDHLRDCIHFTPYWNTLEREDGPIPRSLVPDSFLCLLTQMDSASQKALEIISTDHHVKLKDSSSNYSMILYYQTFLSEHPRISRSQNNKDDQKLIEGSKKRRGKSNSKKNKN